MKKMLFPFFAMVLLSACNNEAKEAEEGESAAAEAKAAPSDLPYTATYSSDFTSNVSDADLKTVLMSYKDWADGDMAALQSTLADSVTADMSDGTHISGTSADIMKRWSTFRDSLSGVTIEMQAWAKMYAADKQQAHVVTWYKEVDTYKDGRVDSAYFHDINRVKDGKISWYSQFKKPIQ